MLAGKAWNQGYHFTITATWPCSKGDYRGGLTVLMEACYLNVQYLIFKFLDLHGEFSMIRFNFNYRHALITAAFSFMLINFEFACLLGCDVGTSVALS